MRNRMFGLLLLAAALGPAGGQCYAANATSVTPSQSATFQCRGIGHQTKGMTEEQCRKAGGTVEKQENWTCQGLRGARYRKGTAKAMTKQDCLKAGGTVKPAAIIKR